MFSALIYLEPVFPQTKSQSANCTVKYGNYTSPFLIVNTMPPVAWGTVAAFACGAATAALAMRLLRPAPISQESAPAPSPGVGEEDRSGADCGAAESHARRSATHIISAESLRRFAAQVFEHCGVLPDDARVAAEILVLADLRGIDSHGIARLKAYYLMLRKGAINPRPDVRILRETASTAVVDGDGLGLVVAPKANAIAMRKAKECGSGWVSVRNTNHYGIAGAYALQSAENSEMIGFSMTNTSPIVAPLFGKRRMLGTNPIAVAFPCDSREGKNTPVVIDLATSVVPFGKVEECARVGSRLLPGWAIDAKGTSA